MSSRPRPGYHAMAVPALVLGAMVTTTGAQPPRLRADQEFHGRPAWVIENDAIRVTLVQSGGHIAEVRFLGDAAVSTINPMFVPAGDGYMGHLVCFPYFGPASALERAQGLRGHGEAGSVAWQSTRDARADGDTLTFYYGADLPKTQYRIERAVTIRRGESVVHVEESVENLAGYDRPYNWNQHATFGAPFVAPAQAVLDTSGGKALTDQRRTAKQQWRGGSELTWPDARNPEGAPISLREFRAVPDGQAYTAILTDRSRDTAWFTLYNTDHRLLIGYVFPAAEHPWIVDWQNQPRTDTAAGVARGIEFGTSPFDEGLRGSIERGQLFGTATYGWIGARQRLTTSFTIFLAHLPTDFNGVQDVQPDVKHIVLREREASRTLRIPHARR